MKKQEQQLPDFARLRENAQKASYLKSVWIALYGPLETEKVKRNGRTRCTYNWKAQPFDNVSSFLRREITSQLIKTDTMFDENDSSLRDEFYGRIYSVLNSLLEERALPFKTVEDLELFSKNSEMPNALPCTEMREFILWHHCGLPVSLKEKRLLRRCLKKFLKAPPRTAKATECIYREKLANINTEVNHFLKKIGYRLKRLKNLYLESQALGDVDENDERLIAISNREKKEIQKTLDLMNQSYLIVVKSNALSESYNILTEKFPILEERLRKT